MAIQVSTGTFKDSRANCIIVFCTKDAIKKDKALKDIDNLTGGLIKRLYTSGDFEGNHNQTAVIYPPDKIKADKIVLAGVGEADKLEPDFFRQASGTTSRLREVKKADTIAIYAGNISEHECLGAAVEGFLLGGFILKEYKTGDDAKKNGKNKLIVVAAGKKGTAALKREVYRAEITAQGVIMARTLAAIPSNDLTPRDFASRARSLAGKHKFQAQVLDEKKIKEEKMGALLGVAQGSAEPPRFVILKYNGGKKNTKPIVLVGKGVTFDTGGICIKGSKLMDEMKGDMQGAAVVLAATVTAARLKLPVNIVTLIPLAENMPSSKAYKPGDILKSRKGLTIEVINTDAEGRLLLADGLDYANKFKPQAVIDIATLTGAAKYILDTIGIPVMGNNDRLLDNIKKASDKTAERVWELPIWDEYGERMKSKIADLKNSGGPNAGTLLAAAFLRNFIGDWPWMHIDIAACDVERSGRPYIPVGTTGMGVRVLVQALADWKDI